DGPRTMANRGRECPPRNLAARVRGDVERRGWRLDGQRRAYGRGGFGDRRLLRSASMANSRLRDFLAAV
ncbi:MAG TPA: hypothetical protein VN961_14310, partial [Streptosporangiaceae bacterium]|nr:hypothetical protein [Streptosporangiaceae bacterium]